MNRMRIWTLSLLFAVLACVAISCGGSSKATMASFEKVQEGMSSNEVVAVLGPPWGAAVSEDQKGNKHWAPAWKSGEATLVVEFSPEGTVKSKRIQGK
jgi:hypothetical protein